MIADGTNKYLFIKKANMLLKPSTQYTFIFDVLENTLVSSNEGDYVFTIFGSSGSIVGGVALTGSNVKTTVFLKTTVSDLDTAVHGFDSYLNNRAISGKLKVRLTMLEGDHTNNPNLPSYFKNIVGVGDKSKNLFNIKDFVEFAKDTTESPFYYPITLEANTQYTFSDSTGMWNGCGFFLELLTDEKEKLFNLIDSNLANRNKFTFTTNAKTQYLLKLYKHNVDKMLSLSTNFQLEKGSTATTYEPYYDGHKIEILSCGKNILNPQKWIYGSSMVWQKFKVNSNLRLNVLFSEVVDYIECYSCEEGEQDLQYGINGSWKVVKVLNNSSKVAFSRKSEKDRYLILCTNQKNFNDVFKNANASFDSDLITLKPYIEDKTQILLDEPLMRLNTSKDEITRDGKLIKRLCLTEVDGTEEWSRFYPHTIEEESIVFVTRLNKDSYINCVQDYRLKSTFAPTNETNTILSKEAVQIYDSKLRVKLLKSRLTSLDVVGFKKWLSSNPIQILYLLKEPIIIDIVPPTLRIFKNGHLTFNTLVAPESNHVVQLNKSGQIQNAIKESQSLDNRINVLENNYDNLILFTMSRLNDLELNYTLK